MLPMIGRPLGPGGRSMIAGDDVYGKCDERGDTAVERKSGKLLKLLNSLMQRLRE